MIFDALKVRPRFDEYDPLGTGSTATLSLTDTVTYTVPAGKTLLIKGIYNGVAATLSLMVNSGAVLAMPTGTKIVDKFKTHWDGANVLMLTAAASTTVIYLDANFILPIKSGTVIKTNNTGVGYYVYGWLVDE